MTRDDIIAMARKAEIVPLVLGSAGEYFAQLERFATLVAANERRKNQEQELMAECMEMVHMDLIHAEIIDKSVPPMMVPEAVITELRRAVSAEREMCAQVCESLDDPRDYAAAIRARSNPSHTTKEKS